MPRYIAFLRAINVGSHVVHMDRLRALFAEPALANVATFIAGGNVIFETATPDRRALERAIEQHLEQALGYAVGTFIRSTREIAAIAAYQAFSPTDLAAAGALHVGFLGTPPSALRVQQLMTFRTDIDDFHVCDREVYRLCRAKISQSTFSGAALEKTLGQPATLRNITTVQKLAAKYAAEA